MLLVCAESLKACTPVRLTVPTYSLPPLGLFTVNCTPAGLPPGSSPPVGGEIVALIVSALLAPAWTLPDPEPVLVKYATAPPAKARRISTPRPTRARVVFNANSIDRYLQSFWSTPRHTRSRAGSPGFRCQRYRTQWRLRTSNIRPDAVHGRPSCVRAGMTGDRAYAQARALAPGCPATARR